VLVNTMTKTEMLVRAPPQVKLAIEEAADEDQQTQSSLILKILSDRLRDRGYFARGGCHLNRGGNNSRRVVRRCSVAPGTAAGDCEEF
jgi:hypothetical protein